MIKKNTISLNAYADFREESEYFMMGVSELKKGRKGMLLYEI